MANIKAVIFDLDGTLLDTIGDIRIAMNQMLDEFGYMAKTREEIVSMIGDGVQVMIQRALPQIVSKNETMVKKAIDKYTEIYKKTTGHTVPFKGIVPLLNALSKRGIKTAILSNKPYAEANAIVLEKLDTHKFEIIIGPNESFPPKPDTRALVHIVNVLKVGVNECLYVGDGEMDYLTPAKLKMPCVSALWGYRTQKQLKKAGAKYFVENPSDVLNVIDNNKF